MAIVTLVTLVTLPALAVNKTVKAGGGGDFTTIQACATAMSAGDSCTVFAGTYNESVTVTAGGVASYKTLTINTGDTVNVYSFSIDSHVKINGFGIGNPASPTSLTGCITIADSATDWFITSNTLTACGTNGMIPKPNANWSYGRIQNNTFSYGASTSSAPDVTPGGFLYCDHCLVEGNTFAHVMQAFQVVGTFLWVRNNSFGPIYGEDPAANFAASTYPQHDCSATLSATTATVSGNVVTWVSGSKFFNSYPGMFVKFNSGSTRYTVDFADTGTGNTLNLVAGQSPPSGSVTVQGGACGNGHGEMIFAQAGADMQHIVMEGNTLANSYGLSNKVALAQSGASGTYGPFTIRFNSAFNFGGAALDNNGGVGAGFPRVVSYNNTWDVDNTGFAAGFISSNHNAAANAAEINNGFYFHGTIVPFVGANPTACDAGTSACSTFTDHNNRAWDTGLNCGTYCYGQVYQAGLFTDIVTNKVTNPQFANYGTGNLALAGGSEWLQAGGSLTTVSAGCGTATLTVGQSDYFQVGDSTLAASILPDVIRVGATNTYTVSSIADQTHITFTGAVTCSNGDGLYLYSDSSGTRRLFNTNPDIGAFQAGVTAPTCTLTASPAVIKTGTSSTLTFTPANTPTTCSIDNGVGSVNCVGATPSVSPTTLTTYTASVSNAGGSGTCSATVTIGGTQQAANTIRTANTIIQ